MDEDNNRLIGLTSQAPYDHFFKILLIGDAFVGKTSLLVRFCDDHFSPSYNMTIGIDFRSKIVVTEGTKERIKLQLWDTAGQERYRTITQAYYRGSHGVLVVYDVTSQASFEHVKKWLREIRTQCGNVNLVLVGNKCDDPEEREVSTKEAKKFATDMKLPFFETSARDNVNVNEVFSTLTALALRTKKAELRKLDISWRDDEEDPVVKVEKTKLLSRLKKHSCCSK